MKESYQFDFEKLVVYQKGIDFTNEIFNITLNFKKEIQYSLGDQFRRAALSVCNNIAEGSQKRNKSKAQFYQYSLNSARECIPMITLCRMQNLIDEQCEDHLRSECVHICNMLARLLFSVKN